MVTFAPEVLNDPVGVIVELVARREPTMERTRINDAVVGVAGGRAKRRRLAQALSERPAVLEDGKSPAPRVVGDLLLALRRAGAVAVSPPVCARCAKHLGSLQRRGEDWYCGVCGPRREPCGVCGNTLTVAFRDRRGGPRCERCPPDDGRDPVEVVVAIVTVIDPTLGAESVIGAMNDSVSSDSQRRQLAWTLEERPELLTGAGAESPLPSVLRLIDRLCDAGATRIVRPSCPHCGRVIPLVKPRDGVRLCRNCVAKSRAETCARCGSVREAATRDEHGRPICPTCLVRDPANQEVCVRCGRRQPVSVRSPDGPLCANCRPWKLLTCAICGHHGPCLISEVTGMPRCRACTQRWAPCTGCGDVAPVRGGTVEAPLCAICTRPDPSFWRNCTTCGKPGRIHAGRCPRCTVGERLRDLLGDETGVIRPRHQALYQALVSVERPTTVAAWLDKSAAPAILRALGDGDGDELTHEALDALASGKTVEHLRSVLVAVGTLPERDEQMIRLERWITRTIAEQSDPNEREVLHRYATWHVLRRLRRRLSDTTTYSQLASARQQIRAAVTVLDWLSSVDLTLATADQGALEAWLASDAARHRREVGHFVRWAKREKLTTLELPAVRWGGPSGVIDTETRWSHARRLIHDDTLEPEDRFAGLLVLLYAQWPAAISRLTVPDLEVAGDDVRLRLGPEPVVLPEPLAALARQLLAARQGHAVIGHQASSPWLFPGGQPGRPISAFQLGERLRRLGLQPGQSRSTALFQLATQLPAALLARMLGIHISVAVAWQRASAGDWTAYAGDYSRRGEAARQRVTRPVAYDPELAEDPTIEGTFRQLE